MKMIKYKCEECPLIPSPCELVTPRLLNTHHCAWNGCDDAHWVEVEEDVVDDDFYDAAEN